MLQGKPMKKITQRLVEKAGESRSLRYAARRARMRRERDCRAAPVGMTVVDGGGRSKDGPYKDEPKTQGHTPCLGHPQFEEVGFGGGACNRKSGGPSKLPSKIGASRVNKPPHSKIGRKPRRKDIADMGRSMLRPYRGKPRSTVRSDCATRRTEERPAPQNRPGRKERASEGRALQKPTQEPTLRGSG